ncbi:hypothetical protein SPHINGOT1_270014 [Sphingomonas sp. T1]|nr:hypothetical protein SPHINGOT1_270014 [Sphingomonas sp. T1]
MRGVIQRLVDEFGPVLIEAEIGGLIGSRNHDDEGS